MIPRLHYITVGLIRHLVVALLSRFLFRTPKVPLYEEPYECSIYDTPPQ